MTNYSVFVLAFLGIIVIGAGIAELLREVNILTVSLDVFGSVLIVVLGIWITVCAVECRNICYEKT